MSFGFRVRAWCSVVAAVALGSGAPGFTAAAPNPMQLTQIDEKAWLQGVRDKLSVRLKVAPDELRFSPGKKLAALVSELPTPPPRGRRAAPRRAYRIVVVDLEGNQRAGFRAASVPTTDDPPRDLRFLDEDRLVYEVALPPPPPVAPVAKAASPITTRTHGAARGKRKPPKAAAGGGRQGAPKGRPARNVPAPSPAPSVAAGPAGSIATDEPAPPRRLFIIQPVARRSRPIRCDGVRFAFSPRHDHLAFVAGKPAATFVAVDGKPVYPRQGRTDVISDPAWSPDGIALALLERRANGAQRLVLVADHDNPTGDTNWDLPPTLVLTGAHVFWVGADKLVVGKSLTSPLFTTSFEVQRPQETR